jgi:ubiquinone/menaquinone biosynthesis C-methylase UbiE
MKIGDKHLNGGYIEGLKVLNLGCGSAQIAGENVVNVDAFPICKPDVVWDLNKTPLPFKDESFDLIIASHVFEHLPNWWDCFCDCARILKPGGVIEVWVPGFGDATRGYRDHVCEININSFYGTFSFRRPGSNAWAQTSKECESYAKFMKFYRIQHVLDNKIFASMPVFIQNFAMRYLRNVVHETGYFFQKLTVDEYKKGEQRFIETGKL